MLYAPHILDEAKAMSFAIETHGNALYGEHPYIVHLSQVVGVARDFGFNHRTIILACWLHDVMEDTAVHYSDLRRQFCDDVADVVYAVTDELGKNRQERHEKTYPKIRASETGLIVKLCDRIANTRFSLALSHKHNPPAVGYGGQFAMYQKEYPNFKAALQTDNEATNELWRELDMLTNR